MIPKSLAVGIIDDLSSSDPKRVSRGKANLEKVGTGYHFERADVWDLESRSRCNLSDDAMERMTATAIIAYLAALSIFGIIELVRCFA